MKLILVDPNSAVCSAWRRHFAGLPEVEIVHGVFEALPRFDCMVSAANSFGIMDGGVDLAIARFFGPELVSEVQRRILSDCRGEQLVGTSLIVRTPNPGHPWLAHTPTMRVPMSIVGTDNVYQAMWAMLLAVEHHNASEPGSPIDVVACPGLGTATGRVPPEEAARQIALAYRNFLNPPDLITWEYAFERDRRVLGL